jgi:hypothetical protein
MGARDVASRCRRYVLGAAKSLHGVTNLDPVLREPGRTIETDHGWARQQGRIVSGRY